MANIQINIVENGTTTLATSGCICDRNIDINVDVPTGGNREDFVPDSALAVSGNCNYKFAYTGWNWFLNLYKNEISTNYITNAIGMFSYGSITEIPFDINLYSTSNENGVSCSNIFEHSALKTAPYIKGKVSSLQAAFNSADELEEIPEDWGDYIDWSAIHTYKYADISKLFYGCRCLRKIPDSLLSQLWCISSYVPYSNMFGYCCRLDEAKNIPVCSDVVMTSSKFGLFSAYNYMLKDLTFATQEDGTPYTVSWHTQTIELDKYIGYGKDESEILDYKVITRDKEVTDDASYQALKNDPNWWTLDVAYSKYNHDSALRTIKSLPDTSAYLATQNNKKNTIKFKGESGSKTDGGAINTLTEDEIAIATAKGWTVQFV